MDVLTHKKSSSLGVVCNPFHYLSEKQLLHIFIDLLYEYNLWYYIRRKLNGIPLYFPLKVDFITIITIFFTQNDS